MSCEAFVLSWLHRENAGVAAACRESLRRRGRRRPSRRDAGAPLVVLDFAVSRRNVCALGFLSLLLSFSSAFLSLLRRTRFLRSSARRSTKLLLTRCARAGLRVLPSPW